MRYYSLSAVFGILFFSALLFADEIIFINGDRLTGKVEEVFDGKIVLKSDMAGKVKVDVSKVKTFSTDEAVEVNLEDGTVFKRRIVQSQQGRFGIADDTGGREFSLDSVSKINTMPEELPKWTGSVSLGVASTHGNTTTGRVNTSVDISKRTEKDRRKFNTDYSKAKQEDPDTGKKTTTEDWWRTRGKYDYFFTKKFYGYLDGRYETDRIAELDRRVIFGIGSGYQWVESKEMNFSTESGLAWQYEKYDNETESASSLSAQFGYHFDKKLYAGLKFINDLTFYPSTERLSDHYVTTTAEIRAPISERMFTNLKVILDYDSTPAEDRGTTDTKYILGVGVNF